MAKALLHVFLSKFIDKWFNKPDLMFTGSIVYWSYIASPEQDSERWLIELAQADSQDSAEGKH